ncbi:MAG: hypothetical protein OXG56_11160 [Gammaproteobacteria bacterium]|nr:hypothetical protein [Gammaproteobacteria bacterium]
MVRKTILFTLIAGLALGGCALPKKPQEVAREARSKLESIVEEAKQAQRESVRNRPIAPPYESVDTPVNAVWLATPVEAYYGELDAREGVRLILKGHPVQFRLFRNRTTTVTPPHSAVTVQEHLDSFMAQANWAYEIVDGVVVVKDWQSVVIPIASLVGEASAILKTSPGAALAETDNSLSINTDAYQELEELVGEILGVAPTPETADPDPAPIFFDPAGNVLPLPVSETPSTEEEPEAKFSVSRSANLLFASATPDKIREINRVIHAFNASVSKRVIIDITVYDVSLTGSHSRHLDVNLLREASNVFEITNTRGVAPGPVDDTLSLGYSGESSDFTWGLVLSWLETQGTVIDSIQRRFDALNNHAVTFADTQEIEYIRERSLATQTLDGGGIIVTPEIEIDTRIVGRTFQLLPTIASDRINIQLAINNRTIVNRTEYGDSLLSGALFNVGNADRMIPLSLGNGETRLLTYFTSETRQNQLDENRLLPVLGDGVDNTSDRVETVIVIRAQIAG